MGFHTARRYAHGCRGLLRVQPFPGPQQKDLLLPQRQGSGFGYRLPGGRRVTDRRTLARIRSLAIPPAWTDVWICPRANGYRKPLF